MYGANVGRLGRLGIPATVNQAICALCVDPVKAVPRYVYYALMHTRRDLVGQAAGAAQQNLNQDLIRRFPIPLPNMHRQRKIAAILSAYDDLIENNSRRIKVLEEMAQRIYREWFVDFRYRGHGGAPLIDSELGPIPEGWELRALGEVVRQTSTTVNPGRFPAEQFQHFSIPAFDNGRMPCTESGRSILSNKFLIDAPCVLYSKLNPRIPRVWWADPLRETRAVASTELLVLQPVAQWNRALVYATLSSAELADRVAGMAGGTSTSHQRVRPAELLALPVVAPPPALCGAYEREAAPLLDLSAKLRAGASMLSQQRDLLLPRLISGEIDVEHLDIAVEEPAA
jgi:type I restriction enzyme S subunit